MATKYGSEVTTDILVGRRQFFIEKVKAPLHESLVRSMDISSGFMDFIHVLLDVWRIVRSVRRYPEPTKKTTQKQMTHVLLDLWDEFFTHQDHSDYDPLFRAIKRITACECEHDSNMSQRMTWFLMRLTQKYLNGEWPPLEPWCPMERWSDPNTLEELRKAMIELRTNLTIGGRDFQTIET